MQKTIPVHGNPENKVFGLRGSVIGTDLGKLFVKQDKDTLNVGWAELTGVVTTTSTSGPTTTTTAGATTTTTTGGTTTSTTGAGTTTSTTSAGTTTSTTSAGTTTSTTSAGTTSTTNIPTSLPPGTTTTIQPSVSVEPQGTIPSTVGVPFNITSTGQSNGIYNITSHVIYERSGPDNPPTSGTWITSTLTNQSQTTLPAATSTRIDRYDNPSPSVPGYYQFRAVIVVNSIPVEALSSVYYLAAVGTTTSTTGAGTTTSTTGAGTTTSTTGAGTTTSTTSEGTTTSTTSEGTTTSTTGEGTTTSTTGEGTTTSTTSAVTTTTTQICALYEFSSALGGAWTASYIPCGGTERVEINGIGIKCANAVIDSPLNVDNSVFVENETCGGATTTTGAGTTTSTTSAGTTTSTTGEGTTTSTTGEGTTTSTTGAGTTTTLPCYDWQIEGGSGGEPSIYMITQCPSGTQTNINVVGTECVQSQTEPEYVGGPMGSVIQGCGGGGTTTTGEATTTTSQATTTTDAGTSTTEYGGYAPTPTTNDPLGGGGGDGFSRQFESFP